MSEANALQANLLQVTPFLHVQDIAETVRFFTERLGFRALLQREDYAYVHRETVGFRILKNSQVPTPGDRRILYYIDVADVDAAVAEIGPKVTDLPEHHVFGPVDQEYGQREYMVRLPDGMVLCYGQAITNPSLPSIAESTTAIYKGPAAHRSRFEKWYSNSM